MQQPFPPRNEPVGLYGRQVSMLDVADTQLGRNVTVKRSDAPQPLIFARGHSQGAQIATVHAQVDVPESAYAAGGGDRAPIVGLISWGQGAAKFTAEVDLRNGTCFSLVASDVTMNVRFDAADDNPDTRALLANVAGAVVWGDRPARARPTRTLPRTVVASAGSATFAVPAFAYSLTLFAPSSGLYAAAATSTITLHGGPAAADDPELVVTTGELGTSQLTQEGLLLSGNTRFVTFTNNSGGSLTVRPSFALAL
jgi:hypothetical protein